MKKLKYFNNKESNSQSIDWIDQCIRERHIKYYEYPDFNNIEEIGRGEFSKVYKANRKQSEKYFALKSFNLDDDTVKEAVNEIKLHREVDFHDHIMKLYGITEFIADSDKKYLLVLEYADGGALNNYLKNNFPLLNWQDKYRLAFQLSSATECLHEEGIVHRDLHSSNVLIHKNSIKLTDFGLSKRIEDNTTEIVSSTHVIPYVDPKAFNKKESEEKSSVEYDLSMTSDVYSVGVLLWELSSGKKPFDDEDYDLFLAMEIAKGLRESIVEGTSEEYSSLYTKCWDGDPDKRPTIQEMVVSLKKIMLSQTSNQGNTNITNERSKQRQQEHNLSSRLISTQFTKDLSHLNTNSTLKSDSKTNIVIIGLVSLFTKITNEGKPRNQHRPILDNYLFLHDVTIEELYKLLVDMKNLSCRCFVGYLHFSGIGTIMDMNKAFSYFQTSSRYPIAQYYLGVCYENGLGTTINEELAFKWYEKSAKSGNSTIGKFALGNCYENGIGIIKDERMAFNWYLEAANNGHAIAQYYIGNYYQQGIYVNRDYNIAFYYYNLSAQGESVSGINMLGYCYLNGVGTSVDKEMGFELYLKAANTKYSIAQYNVAVCFEDGIGTTKDSEKAMEWYKKSAENGYNKAIKRLEELSENSLFETKEKEIAKGTLTEQQIIQQWRLHHGLFLDGHNIRPSKQAVFVDDGNLDMSLYIGEPIVYININDPDNPDTSTSSLAFNDDIFDEDSHLQLSDICINFPVAEITYGGEFKRDFLDLPEGDEKLHDLYGHMIADKFLAGGQLFIKNFNLSVKHIDVLKFYIIWAYNSAKNNDETQFNNDSFDAPFSRLETLNGVKLNTPKKLADWLNNLYQDNIMEIISYKNLSPISRLKKGNRILTDDFETLNEIHPGIANFREKLSLEEWVGDKLYFNLIKWIENFHLLHGLLINKSYKAENSKKIGINFIEIPKVNLSDKVHFEVINPMTRLENNLISNNIFSIKNSRSFPFIKSNIKSYGDYNHILFKYEQYEIHLNKDDVKPTKEFEQAVEKALNGGNPLKDLQDIFDEYGHLFPQRIILGRSLRNILPKSSSSNMLEKINLESPIFESLNISYLLTQKGKVVVTNDLSNWIQNTNDDLEIIGFDNVIPFYKILKAEQQRKIDDILNNDFKIIMTGITDLKDLNNDDVEYYKRIKMESSLEDEDYEVFGSIISKDNSKLEKLENFYVNFGLYNFNRFYAMIKRLENTSIDITKCHVLWMIIGKPSKLSVNNQDFQVNCIKKSITLQPDKSTYHIKTPPLSLGNTILINSHYKSNCEPTNIRLVEWENESIKIEIIKSTFNESDTMSSNQRIISDSDSDNGDNPLINIKTAINMDLIICIISTDYNSLKIDNKKEGKYSLDLAGFILTKENLNKDLLNEIDKFDSIQNIIEYSVNYLNYELCSDCNQPNTDYNWCQQCNSRRFEQNFKNWTSGNHDIDKFIQKAQLKAKNHREVLEWIEPDRFEDIKHSNEGGLAIIYKAIWKDGFIKSWGSENNQRDKECKKDFQVALKKFLKNDRFLSEVESHLIMNYSSNVVHCYGITKHPETNEFMIVMEYANNGDLKQYLSTSSLNLMEKLKILLNIIKGLNEIHNNGLIHRDFNCSNILLRDEYFAFIAGFGLCKPVNDSQGVEEETYGVLPYIAPEVLIRKEYTQSSDIYGFGIIAYEVCTGLNPYHDLADDDEVIIVKVCQGLRPIFDNNKVPPSIVKVIKHCWNEIPSKRPKAFELFKSFSNLLYKCYQTKYYQTTSIALAYKKITENMNRIEVGNANKSEIENVNKKAGKENVNRIEMESAYKPEITSKLTKRLCEKCGEQYKNAYFAMYKWCKPCQINYFKKNCINWTSGNERIDDFIQEMQLKIDSYNDIVFEWIPYNQFDNIEEMGKDVYSAIWKDGQLYYDLNTYELTRKSDLRVILKSYDLQSITDNFLNQIKTYSIKNNGSNILNVYGISQNPDTRDYITVFQEGDCKKCGKQYTNIKYKWCKPCQMNYLTANFTNWTSKNEKIDNLIQEKQLKIDSHNDIVFEWIPFNQFNNIKEIDKGGFATVYSAIWKNGPLLCYNQNELTRKSDLKVALKYLHNSQNIKNEFLNEVKAYSIKNYGSNILKAYGISQNPGTGDYIMVLDYAEGGNFNDWINKNYEIFNWSKKLEVLVNIINGLKEIHQKQMIHRDVHTGNILFNGISSYISDMGLCEEVGKIDEASKVFGIMSYIAPEVLKGESYTQAADIYSFGMIMYFVATGKQPFANRVHDQDLVLDICTGIRPKINEPEAPKCYIGLMNRCLDSNPKNRPNAIEILELVKLFKYSYLNELGFEDYHYEIQIQFEEAEEYRKVNSLLIKHNTVTTHINSYETNNMDPTYSSVEIIDFTKLRL